MTLSIEQLQQIVNNITSKLDKGDTVYHTLLSGEKGYNDIIEYIEQFDVNNVDNIDICALMQICCYLSLTEDFRILLEGNKKESIEKFNKITSIFFACYVGNEELVKMIYDMEWDLTILKFALECSLFASVRHNDISILRFLIEQKKVNIDINIQSGYINRICQADQNIMKDINTFFVEQDKIMNIEM